MTNLLLPTAMTTAFLILVAVQAHEVVPIIANVGVKAHEVVTIIANEVMYNKPGQAILFRLNSILYLIQRKLANINKVSGNFNLCLSDRSGALALFSISVSKFVDYVTLQSFLILYGNCGTTCFVEIWHISSNILAEMVKKIVFPCRLESHRIWMSSWK